MSATSQSVWRLLIPSSTTPVSRLLQWWFEETAVLSSYLPCLFANVPPEASVACSSPSCGGGRACPPSTHTGHGTPQRVKSRDTHVSGGASRTGHSTPSFQPPAAIISQTHCCRPACVTTPMDSHSGGALPPARARSWRPRQTSGAASQAHSRSSQWTHDPPRVAARYLVEGHSCQAILPAQT